MTPLVIAEFICAVFVSVLTIGQFREYNGSGSSRWLIVNSIVMFCWLLSDALAGVTGLQYTLTLLAYTLGGAVLYFSCGYFGAYIAERTPLNPWVFRVPRIIALLSTAASAAEFIAGRFVVYKNGAAVAVNAVPVYFSLTQICIIAFSVAVAIRKRKALGWKAVALFCLFSLSSVLGIITAPFLGADYSVAFAAISLMIIITFLHTRKAGFRPENAFAGLTVLTVFYLILQSGALSKDPVIEVRPDNCYDETLYVITDDDYLPYSFYDSEGNESGHDVELIIMLANEMRMNLDLRFLPWDDAILEAVSGSADVLMTCDYSDSFEGVDLLLKTEPVSADEFIVYSKMRVASVDELYDMKCAVMKDGNVMPQIGMLNLDRSCQMYPDNRAAMTALEDGEADCAIMRYTVGEALLRELGYSDISGRFSVGKAYMCFGITANNEEMLNRINEAIRVLKQNGDLKKLDKKWLTTFIHTYSLKEILSNNPWLMGVITLIIVAFILLLMREKKKKIEEEAENNARLFTLEDDFIALYDVDLENGRYESFDREDFERKSIREKNVSTVGFFEYMREYAAKAVLEEDRKGLLEVQRKENILRGLDESDHIDYYYRLITGTGFMWMKMRIVYRNAEKKNVIIGVFNADEEVAAREQTERLRTEQMANIAGDFSSYIINPKTNRFQVFKQDEYLSNTYTADEDYESSFGRYIDNDIYEPDREMVREAMTVKALTANLEKENEYRLKYRDISSGSPRWYELRAAKLSGEEILLGFSDINETYAGQIIFSKMNEDYFALVYVYLDYRISHAVKDEPGLLIGAGNTIPYSEMIGKIVSTMGGETKAYFDRLGSVDYLKEKFRTENKAEYIYTSDYTGETHWINLAQLVLERDRRGEPLVVAFGFRFLDEETKNVQALQIRIAEQQKELEKAFEMAEAANRAKTDFLFNMSHDIRTPMNAIIGFTNIAMKEVDNREKALDSLGKVRTSSDILLNLINDVLDMSRIESGKVELHEEMQEITEVFSSFEPAMANLAASKKINLQFSIAGIRDRYIYIDGPRFDRVLINIVSNAIKYTPSEGSVRVTAEQIECADPGYGNYRFTVADNGIGMSEEFQKHMFEDFSREENAATRGIQGTGLGLALAKRLVDLMRGTITCESTQGKGTTFTIEFPFRLQNEKNIRETAEKVQERRALDLRGKRALLVEDNELNREIAEEILSDEGIIVEMSPDGGKAVDRVLETGPEYYDFILMDIQMPVMDGYEATREIRGRMPDLKAPIIALSANAFAEDRKKSIEAGMDDHVAKPINVEELMNALAKFLN